MKSIKVCEYSRSRSFHYDLILQDQASGERSKDQWSSGLHLRTEMTSHAHILIKKYYPANFLFIYVYKNANILIMQHI